MKKKTIELMYPPAEVLTSVFENKIYLYATSKIKEIIVINDNGTYSFRLPTKTKKK